LRHVLRFPGHSRDTDGSVGFLIPQNHTQH